MQHKHQFIRRGVTACLAFILAISSSQTALSQLVVNPGGSPATIINNLIGAGLTVSNVSLVCGPSGPTAQYGTFNGTASNIGLPNGVILTTGRASLAVGPNNTSSSGACPVGNMTPDPQLSTIDPNATRDICKLEFDVIPHCSSLQMQFVFGSEEYPEYVNTVFNDAFGFFVTGPGGPNCTPNFFNNTNVAVLPNGSPVSINNINNGNTNCPNPMPGPCVNCAFYVNNCGGATVQYDGFTAPIQINLSVCACSTYHWKFIIADAQDCIYDSGVLLDYLNSCNSPLAYNVTTVPSACGCNGSATVNITTGVPPYTYLWMPGGDTNQTATGLCPGIYTVSVMDGISCNTPVVQNVVITGSSTPVTANITSVVNVMCAGDSTGSATVFASSGAAPFSYLWSDGQATQTATGLPAGNYSVIVSDVNNCADTVQVTITEPPALTIAFNNFAHTTCAHDNGSIAPTYSGGTGSLSYLWSNGANTASLNNLPPGTYTVTVTDGNSCTLTGSFTVNPSTVPVLSTSPNVTICAGDVTTLTASGADLYVWSPATGLNTTVGPIVDANPLTSMIYQVIGSDTLGCTDTAFINVTVNPLPVMSISPSVSICEGETTSLVVSGATTYSWNPSSGLDNASSSSPNASPLQTTTYTVTGDILGCTATVSVTVTVDTVPVVAFGPPYSSSCAPLAVQFMDLSTVVPSGSTYWWQFGDGGTSTQQNPSYTYNIPGSYTVTLTITSGAGCSSSTSLQAADVFANPIAAFYVAPTVGTLGNVTSFFDQSQPLISTWNWNFGDGLGTASIQHPTYTYPDTGTFTITLVVTTQGGCMDSTTATILIRDDFFSLYVPNVFTPNGDGINDLFIPNGIYERISFYVFDRWGEEVFHTTSKNDAWNGKFRDHKGDCPNGTYVYMIDAWDVYDRVHHFIGKVTILR